MRAELSFTMGNAASIVGSEEEYHQRGNLPRAPHNIPYSELEKICATGIFLNSKVPSAKSQYKELVEVSIQKGKLDHLEILVLAGNIKEIDPLHIAAKYGNLESLELLNSAGFNAELSDKQGRVPMHLCAMNRSPDSVLCAHYLAVIAPKVLNYRDKKVHTCLYIYIYIHSFINAHTYTHTYTHTCTLVHAYTHAYTHRETHLSSQH